MKIKTLLIFLFLLWQKLFSQIDFYHHISLLASDSLQGRSPGTIYEQQAADYIYHFWQKNQLKTTLQKFSFTFEEKNDSAINIIAKIDNHKAQTILITAHYDHLGLGNKKSKEIVNRHQIHNGADDNASGVAMMLELSQQLVQYQDSLPYNYLFVAYSAHEIGLYGSQFFVKSPICQQENIRAVLNFDMVGRLNKNTPILKVGGIQSDSTLYPFFQQNETHQLHFRLADEQVLYSDIKVFYEKQIPALTFTTGIHEDYHRASDDSDKINFEGMRVIFDCIWAFICQIPEKK